jgi:hypothetical protein
MLELYEATPSPHIGTSLVQRFSSLCCKLLKFKPDFVVAVLNVACHQTVLHCCLCCC